MGYGSWSDDDFKRKETVRKTSGKSAFDYSDNTIKSEPMDKWAVHPQLNPKGANRESRDSITHPESLAIAVIFDVTGSMQNVPRLLQKGLSRLMGLLLQGRWAEHPHILFGANGDAFEDRVPLQIGQFESDIAMDADLGRFLLEGGGGGNGGESYDLAIYMASRHFSIDCFEKRNEKGYLFIIGDEMPFPYVSAEKVQNIIGDNIAENIAIKQIIQEARERYHIFMIRPTNTSWGLNSGVQDKWVSLLGREYVIKLEYPEAISETIALIVGITEGKTTLKDGIKEIKNIKEAILSNAAIESLAMSLGAVRSKIEKDKDDIIVLKSKNRRGKKPGRI